MKDKEIVNEIYHYIVNNTKISKGYKKIFTKENQSKIKEYMNGNTLQFPHVIRKLAEDRACFI